MYRWDELGLKNVWLANGYTLHDTPYGRGVSFKDVEGLTRAVCLALARKPGKLTGAEFRYLRQAGLCMSQPSLGKVLGADAQSIARWEKSGKVPKWANRMIRLIHEAHADGDVAIRRVVEHIKGIDRPVNRRIVLEQTARRGWRARMEEEGIAAAV